MLRVPAMSIAVRRHVEASGGAEVFRNYSKY
jgi:hypothetical protein